MFITTTGREATLAAGALLDRLEAHAEYQPRCFATAEAPDSLLTALGLIRLKTWRHFSRKTVDLKRLPTQGKDCVVSIRLVSTMQRH